KSRPQKPSETGLSELSSLHKLAQKFAMKTAPADRLFSITFQPEHNGSPARGRVASGRSPAGCVSDYGGHRDCRPAARQTPGEIRGLHRLTKKQTLPCQRWEASLLFSEISLYLLTFRMIRLALATH